jgi:hypothetical protein
MESEILFEVSTLLGFRVRVTRAYWEFIVTMKHPVMRERATEVQDVLQNPDEVRQSRSDPMMFLFYLVEVPGRWLCVVIKCLNNYGFLITTIPPMRSKKGNGYGTDKDFP